MLAVTDQQAVTAHRRSQAEKLRALAAIHGGMSALDMSALDAPEEWWTEAPGDDGRAGEQ